jgi:hypothetical protein
MNFQIRCQIQDPTIRSLGLPSCSSYFSAYFKHKIFLVNYYEADFVLVFRSPRTCPTVPKSKIYEEKENVFKTKGRNVKGKIKITMTSEAGHSLSLTSENCNYVVESKVQTPAQVPLEDLSDTSIGCRSTMAKYEGSATQNRCQNAGKTTTKTKTTTLTELPDGENSETSKKLRKTPLNGASSGRTSGNAVSTKKSPTTNISLQKRERKFKHQFRNNKIIINNMFYQYKKNYYQYKQNYYWVQPNSTSRLTSGMAPQSTLGVTLTLSGNNITNVYQYITIYMTLTLRPTTSETNMESHKNWVQPTSTLRLTPGLASRSTLRLTLTLSGNNNTNVYQYNTIYMTLTLRPTT